MATLFYIVLSLWIGLLVFISDFDTNYKKQHGNIWLLSFADLFWLLQLVWYSAFSLLLLFFYCYYSIEFTDGGWWLSLSMGEGDIMWGRFVCFNPISHPESFVWCGKLYKSKQSNSHLVLSLSLFSPLLKFSFLLVFLDCTSALEILEAFNHITSCLSK